MKYLFNNIVAKVLIGFLSLLFLVVFISCYSEKASVDVKKPKLIVTTDLGQDPDDMQSIVRLLHYANEFEILALIANGDSNEEYELPEIRTDLLFEALKAYDTILPNLRKVDKAYPSETYLKSIVKAGCSGNSRKKPVFDYIGEGKNTPGSDWIIKQVDANEGPIHISVWGGAADIAQALFDVKWQRSAEELKQFVAKLRIFLIGTQDSSNQWIIDNFPDLWMILALSLDGDNWKSGYRGMFLGGDMSVTSKSWLNDNVIGQNALGNLYPQNAWTSGGTVNPNNALKEGDTPSFLYFLPNGLNHVTNPNWGSWGGRYQEVRPNFYRDTADTFFDVSVDSLVTNHKATVFRWRPDFQADFAARVQWGKGDESTINHYPEIVINKNQGQKPLYIFAENSDQVFLDSGDSFDVDNDKLKFEWFVYNEIGDYNGDKSKIILNSNSSKTVITIPDNGTGSFHIILKVTDNAMYPLSSYKRIVVNIE